ncbi:MAG TPA: HAMP domain-containing sensor histidine kinase [Bacteroidales bacterium]|nr:HAMP domain-containing sensor histidine kinase [Bacteroidales bacterium]
MRIKNYTTSDSLYKWIFEYADFGIIITDHELTVTDVNRWLLEQAGKEKDSVQGKHLLEAFTEIKERKLEHYLYNALHGASTILTARFHGYLLKLRSEHDEQAGIMKQTVRITPLYDDDLITGLIIHIEDVTERLIREEQMQKQNEELHKLNSTKDRFFRIIAHDLRSPFTALLGFSEILLNDENMTEKQRRDIIKMLHDSIGDNYVFLENLLKWSQLQTGHFELQFTNVRLKEITDHIISIATPLIRSKEIEVDVSGITPDTIIYTDKQAITSVIYNLFFNALKFTPAGGRVDIRSVEDEDATIIFVRDNGVGIKEEKLDKLFRIDEKTVSTPGTNKERGSGMGLLLVKEFVDKLGGEIWAESIEGAGSTFYISIPLQVTGEKPGEQV